MVPGNWENEKAQVPVNRPDFDQLVSRQQAHVSVVCVVCSWCILYLNFMFIIEGNKELPSLFSSTVGFSTGLGTQLYIYNKHK